MISAFFFPVLSRHLRQKVWQQGRILGSLNCSKHTEQVLSAIFCAIVVVVSLVPRPSAADARERILCIAYQVPRFYVRNTSARKNSNFSSHSYFASTKRTQKREGPGNVRTRLPVHAQCQEATGHANFPGVRGARRKRIRVRDELTLTSVDVSQCSVNYQVKHRRVLRTQTSLRHFYFMSIKKWWIGVLWQCGIGHVLAQ